MQKSQGKEDMTFDEWITYGFTRDWNSAPICHTHDGFPPQSEDCAHYIIIYKDAEEAGKTIEKFPPALWRAFTRKLRWKD